MTRNNSAALAALAMLACACACAGPATAQTMVDRLIGKLTRSKTAGVPQSGAAAVMAPISAAQSAEVDRLLAQPVQDARIAGDRRDAAPLIRTIVSTAACARNELAWNALNRQRLEPKNWTADGSIVSYAPMRLMRYHDKGTCLDAARIVDWTKRALNALAFRVYYIAADSGEAANQGFMLQKGTEGQWLLRNVDWVQQ